MRDLCLYLMQLARSGSPYLTKLRLLVKVNLVLLVDAVAADLVEGKLRRDHRES